MHWHLVPNNKQLWLFLNFLENIGYFRYCRLQCHGALPFYVWFMRISPLKGKRLFSIIASYIFI
jgi:hypothetical protein